jgi:hypothetical protein
LSDYCAVVSACEFGYPGNTWKVVHAILSILGVILPLVEQTNEIRMKGY